MAAQSGQAINVVKAEAPLCEDHGMPTLAGLPGSVTTDYTPGVFADASAAVMTSFGSPPSTSKPQSCRPLAPETHVQALSPRRSPRSVTSGSQRAAPDRPSAAGAARRPEPEHRLQQREHRAGRPGLRHVGAEILHREIVVVALHAGVQLRQLARA